MELLLGTAGLGAVVVSGVLASRLFSRLGRSYWLCGYFISLVFIGLLVTARFNAALGASSPFSWVVAGRGRYVVTAWAIILGLMTPVSRLHRRWERWVVCLLAGVFVVRFSAVPFLAPIFLRGDLSALRTQLDPQGICLQSRDYTCGPAAAVTALKKLGFPAQEGEIAVLSHTSPVTGTLPVCLESALQSRYGPAGLRCRYRYFKSVAELKGAGITLAIVRDAFLRDHCVAVLGVSDKSVVVADPALGMLNIPREQFEKSWRFTGIILERRVAHNI